MSVIFPMGVPTAMGREPRTVRPVVNVTVDVIEAATGRLLERHRGHNLVTTSGLNLLRDLLNGDDITGLTEFGLGTGGTAAAAGDTALQTEVHRDTLSRTIAGTETLTAQYFLSSPTLNGTTIREAGLFTDEDTLFARYVLPSPIAKTSGNAVTFTWVITFTVTEAEAGSMAMLELCGSQDAYETGTSYPAGATLDTIVPGSGVLYIDSDELEGTWALEGLVKVSNGTATPTICLVNLDDGSPNTALTGSTVSGTAGNQTGVRVRSGTITFPAGGDAKQLAVKAKTDEADANVWAWGLRLVRTS